jgi:hypothetical protein
MNPLTGSSSVIFDTGIVEVAAEVRKNTAGDLILCTYASGSTKKAVIFNEYGELLQNANVDYVGAGTTAIRGTFIETEVALKAPFGIGRDAAYFYSYISGDGKVRLVPSGGQKIDGLSSYTINRRLEAVKLVSTRENGTSAWRVLSTYASGVGESQVLSSPTVLLSTTPENLLFNQNSGSFTARLPRASNCPGKPFSYRLIGSNNTNSVTFTVEPRDTINGQTTLVLSGSGTHGTIRATDDGWYQFS